MRVSLIKSSGILVIVVLALAGRSAIGSSGSSPPLTAQSNPASMTATTALTDATVAALPRAGMSMQHVESTFGAPAEKLLSRGKPPITVWRYALFNVYFENQQVVHSVHFVPYVRPVQIIIE